MKHAAIRCQYEWSQLCEHTTQEVSESYLELSRLEKVIGRCQMLEYLFYLTISTREVRNMHW